MHSLTNYCNKDCKDKMQEKENNGPKKCFEFSLYFIEEFSKR